VFLVWSLDYASEVLHVFLICYVSWVLANIMTVSSSHDFQKRDRNWGWRCVFHSGLLEFFSADSFVLIYINCWELMKSVGRHGSSSSGSVHDNEGDAFWAWHLYGYDPCTRSSCVSFGFAGTFKVLSWSFATIMSLICFCRSVGLVFCKS